MSTSQDYHELGMDRPIARRDFLNGVAIGIATGVSALASAQAGHTGGSRRRRGELSSLAHRTSRQLPRCSRTNSTPSAREICARSRVPTSDAQKNTIWLSSAAASPAFRPPTSIEPRSAPNPKILILDNHDDFGGHAKRNEFHYQGKTFIGFGGTMGIETPVSLQLLPPKR